MMPYIRGRGRQIEARWGCQVRGLPEKWRRAHANLSTPDPDRQTRAKSKKVAIVSIVNIRVWIVINLINK